MAKKPCRRSTPQSPSADGLADGEMMSSLAAYLSALVRRIEALERRQSGPSVLIQVGSDSAITINPTENETEKPDGTIGFRSK